MIIQGDARHLPLADKSVHCVVTSPPYFGLRDYGTGQWEGGAEACEHKRDVSAQALTSTLGGSKRNVGDALAAHFRDECGLCGAVRVDRQIGLEQTPEAYVAELVAVFREVWRVLRDDGTVWLNIGDSYGSGARTTTEAQSLADGCRRGLPIERGKQVFSKQLIGIPWRVAFALQADGWILRSDIIWHAPNKMPESVTDRPTKSHEYVFLLAKSERYFYDYLAIAEPYAASTLEEAAAADYTGLSLPGYEAAQAQNPSDAKRSIIESVRNNGTALRNKRTVWSIPTRPYSEAHFATFPPALVEPCVLAGTSAYGCCALCGTPWEQDVEKETRPNNDLPAAGRKHDGKLYRNAAGGFNGDRRKGWRKGCTCITSAICPPIVLDPFCGSGTVLEVAERFGRRAIGVDLGYQPLSKARTAQRGLPFLAAEA